MSWTEPDLTTGWQNQEKEGVRPETRNWCVVQLSTNLQEDWFIPSNNTPKRTTSILQLLTIHFDA